MPPQSGLDTVKTLCVTVLTGVLVALIYYGFEAAVHESIVWVWTDLLPTETNRLLVVPTAIVLGLAYFTAVHFLDPAATPQHGLGEAPAPSLKKLLTVLFVGFLSLLGGAVLGPEAILVPAALICGAWLAHHLVARDATITSAMSGAGIIALFAAFFNSFFIGLLAVFILTKQGAKLTIRLGVLAVLASGSSYATLLVLRGSSLVQLPDQSWAFNLGTALTMVAFVAVGWLMLKLLEWFGSGYDQIEANMRQFPWQVNAIVASTGIGLLYLAGGSLVQFTGNMSFLPLFDHARDLGLAGLIWVLAIKLAAIAWSRSMNYRGGMIFPSLFACAVVAAIASLYLPNIGVGLAMCAVFVGMVLADRKSDVLF